MALFTLFWDLPENCCFLFFKCSEKQTDPAGKQLGGGDGLEFALPSSGKMLDIKNWKLDQGKFPEAIQTQMTKCFQQPKIWLIHF